MQVEVIELGDETTLGSLLTSIERAKGPVVVLVSLVDDHPLLDSPIQWATIQRRAARQGLHLVIVSHKNKRLRALGRLSGIPGVSSLAEVETAVGNGHRATSSPIGLPEVWQRSDGEQARRLRRIAGQTTTGKAARQRPLIALPSWFGNAGLLLFLLLLIGALAISAVLLIPSADVTLMPMRQPIAANVSLSAVSGVTSADFERRLVPSRTVVVDVEGRGEIPTTGKSEVPDTAATGTVIFVNQRPLAVTIPAGTVVATSTGTNVRFQTLGEAILPSAAGATVEVPIEALVAGPGGNVRAFTINTIQGPLSLLARVVNEHPTTGGALRQANVVTQSDKDTLRLEAERELREAAYQRLSADLGAGEMVLPETIRTVTLGEVFDRFVDEPADTLSLRLQVRATGLVVDGEAGRQIALSQLEGLIPAGSRLLADGISITPGMVTAASSDQVQYSLNAAAYFVRPIQESDVGSTIYRLPIETVESVLLDIYPLARPPEISVVPGWYVKALGLMPLLPWRVNVHISYEYGGGG